jgi:cellulose synthase/poly-beta-1,6-N-acetylglucosamine synthase-like glycosyltransferase
MGAESIPALPGEVSLPVSIIIPVLNRRVELHECLEALRQQGCPILDVVVVDHGSTDGTHMVAREFGATVVNAEGKESVNHCRNLGAQAARGAILVFFDSDTVCRPRALERALAHFSDPSLDAVVGVYSAEHRHQNAASQFKNLWIRYSYLRSVRHIDWIFGAASIIRRESFQHAGGFDGAMMMKYGGEDLEFGKRMARLNLRILLEPGFEVEHLKRHTVVSLIANDLRRSDGFVRIAQQVGHMMQSMRSGFVNVYPAFIYSAVLSWFTVVSLIASFFSAELAWLPLASFITFLTLNGHFLLFFLRHRGIWQTLQAAGILFVDTLACAVGGSRGITKILSATLRVGFSRELQPRTEME